MKKYKRKTTTELEKVHNNLILDALESLRHQIYLLGGANKCAAITGKGFFTYKRYEKPGIENDYKMDVHKIIDLTKELEKMNLKNK